MSCGVGYNLDRADRHWDTNVRVLIKVTPIAVGCRFLIQRTNSAGTTTWRKRTYAVGLYIIWNILISYSQYHKPKSYTLIYTSFVFYIEWGIKTSGLYLFHYNITRFLCIAFCIRIIAFLLFLYIWLHYYGICSPLWRLRGSQIVQLYLYFHHNTCTYI